MKIVVLSLLAFTLRAQTDWPVFGHDPGGMRFSPLKQVNASTVAKLKLAWTFDTEAVAQSSKQGYLFILNRLTGKSLYDVKEVPVANDNPLPGGSYWPTQPVPVKPAASRPNDLSARRNRDRHP